MPKKKKAVMNAKAMDKIAEMKSNFGKTLMEGFPHLHAMASEFDAESISATMKWDSPDYAIEGEYLPEITMTVRMYRGEP